MKYSKQREQILEIVNSSYCHPDAYMVYKQVKETIPDISLGTVYRNLKFLCDNNLIRKLSISNENDRFDHIDSHCHLYCIRCHNIIDISDDLLQTFDKIILENSNFQILSDDLVFNGICHECSERKENYGIKRK